MFAYREVPPKGAEHTDEQRVFTCRRGRGIIFAQKYELNVFTVSAGEKHMAFVEAFQGSGKLRAVA
jgi:hypothetical protein